MKPSELKVGDKIKAYHCGGPLVGFISKIAEANKHVCVCDKSADLWNYIWVSFDAIICKYEAREEEIPVSRPKPIEFVVRMTEFSIDYGWGRPSSVGVMKGQTEIDGQFIDVSLPLPLECQSKLGDAFKVTIEPL